MTVSYGDLDAGWFVTALAAFNSPADDANDEYIALKQLKEAWDLEVLAATAKTEADAAAAEAVTLMGAAQQASNQATAQLLTAQQTLQSAQTAAAEFAAEADSKEAALRTQLEAATGSINTLKSTLSTFMLTKHTHDSTEPDDIVSRRLARNAIDAASDTAHVLALKARVRAQIEVDAATIVQNRAVITKNKRVDEFGTSARLAGAAATAVTDCADIVAAALVAYNAVRSA